MPSAYSEPTHDARVVEAAVRRFPTHVADGRQDAAANRRGDYPDLADAIDGLNLLARTSGVTSLTAHAAGVVLYYLQSLTTQPIRR